MKTSNKNKDSYVKATNEGRLYIETVDFFKVDKVQKMVATLMDSGIYKQIEERKDKGHNQSEAKKTETRKG